MQSSYGSVRIHAGLYISGDGCHKIRRVRNELKRCWEWHVFNLSDGQFVYSRKFRTLSIARQYVKSLQQPSERLF